MESGTLTVLARNAQYGTPAYIYMPGVLDTKLPFQVEAPRQELVRPLYGVFEACWAAARCLFEEALDPRRRDQCTVSDPDLRRIRRYPGPSMAVHRASPCRVAVLGE